MKLPHRMPLFSGRLWPALAMFLALAVAFGVYVRAEKSIDRANERRHLSLALANQLRQSSDDLTRMARTYVVTGDPRYKKYYQDILEIRNGRQPWPAGYLYPYWDLVLADAQAAKPGAGAAIPLLELMREAGFAADELRKLAEAKANSDGLTAIEFEAMKLVEKGGPDAAASRNKALLMMHDAGYHAAKATIMKPIGEAYELMEQRTADEVRATAGTATAFRVVFIACVLGAMFMLWRVSAALRSTLGGSAEDVRTHILRIGRGDFASIIAVAPGMERSVLAGLAAMQLKLQAGETRHQEAEAELRASADRLNEAQRIARVGSWMLDMVSGELIWSAEVFRLFEIDAAQFGANYQAFLDAVHPDDRDAVNQAYTRSLKTRMPYELTHRLLMGDGRIKWVHERCVTHFDAAGQPRRSQGTVQDVTERKEAEQALRQSEARFRCLTEISSDFYWESDAEHRLSERTESKREAAEQVFQQHSSLGARRWEVPYLAPDEEGWRRHRAQLDAHLPFRDFEIARPRANGAVHHISVSGDPLFDAAGNFTGYRGVGSDITARKEVEQNFAASETRLRAVLDGVHSSVVTITERGIVESFNQSAERLFGYSAAEVVGNNVKMLMPEPHRAAHDGYLEDYRRGGVRKVIGRRTDVMARRKDGSSVYVELAVTETVLGGRKLFIGSINDISFRKAAEAELRIAAAAFESQEGIVVTDADGIIQRVNQAFIESTGYSAAEAIGQTPKILKSGRHPAAFYGEMWDRLKTTGAWQGEVWDRRKNGEVYPKWLSISAVRGDDGRVTHYVGTHQDITERKQAEEKIKELAFFDPLTRLPNRTLLMDRLKQAMTAGHRNGTLGAVLFIDLDHFKTLNDTLGHDKGDLLLQQAAQRISRSVREGDTVARLGGDEFVVVLGSLNANIEEAATQTEAVGEKILAGLQQMYQLGDIDHRSTASIGATLFRGYDTSIDDLLKQADLAMYTSKETGRNALHFFDPAMQTVVLERSALEAALRKAIAGRQFVLHYQAQVVDAGRVTGAEVLVRWQHPERGMVVPAEFIPLAEDTGLILALGQWVLETACAQLALWASQPEMSHLTVAVNVSAQQFREPDFVDKVLAVIGQAGANPNRLKLELTESLLVDNVQGIIEKMFALKARGVGFALDDFGTGYSSLSYLKRLPLDQLKIDKSFVRDVLVDPNDAAIARTIVALAQTLGLGVIAEGVETETQRDFLAAAGCHAYQGYFFSRPLPLSGFEEFVRRGAEPRRPAAGASLPDGVAARC